MLAEKEKISELNPEYQNYICKQIFVKAIFDPILSGEIFQYIYDQLDHSRKVNMVCFSFNDQQKFIDITFRSKKNLMDDSNSINEYYNKCIGVISNAFYGAFRMITYGTNYNRLLNINLDQAILFKDTVANKEYLLSNLHNCMSLGIINETDLLIRVTLV